MEIFLGNSLDILKGMFNESVDAIVTDPPYGLSFMGKKWDYDVPSVAIWKECLRVLKPGGHALIACGTRTQHRMAVNIEDAGFEIRDVITWLYGSGFPKSLDVSKAIDKANGDSDRRPIIGKIALPCSNVNKTVALGGSFQESPNLTSAASAASAASAQWQGWGTALKPACEFWTLARKPLGESTVAKNVLKHGVGGINVDGCRVGFANDADERESKTKNQHANFESGPMTNNVFGDFTKPRDNYNPPGRFPANLILDEEAGAALDAQSGTLKNGGQNATSKKGAGMFMDGSTESGTTNFAGDRGGASRFFYTAKASKSERNAGCEGLPKKHVGTYAQDEWSRNNMGNTPDVKRSPIANHHPTVKPIKLMRYLCRLITPPGGLVLDPFMGSGSTGVAAREEGFDFLGVELMPEYFEIAKARLDKK